MNKISKINNCDFEGCRKKLKLIKFKCKCERTFCTLHRLPEQHFCNYDYKNQLDTDKKINEIKCISNKIIKF